MLLGFVVAGIVAQSCAAMLPEPGLEFEWYRDGRPFARDVLIRRTASQRVYQRRLENGSTTERVVACTSVDGATYLTERIGTGTTIRIPVELAPGEVREVGGAAVRRVDAPPGAATNMTWFAVSDPGVRLIGMRRGAGITEVRTPVRGGFTALRAVANWRQPAPPAASKSEVDALSARVHELEQENRRLRDSIAVLASQRPAAGNRGPAAGGAQPGGARRDTTAAASRTTREAADVPELAVAAAHAARLEFDDAIASLRGAIRRLSASGGPTGERHPALAPLDSVLRRVMAECIRYRDDPPPGVRVPRCTPEAGIRP